MCDPDQPSCGAGSLRPGPRRDRARRVLERRLIRSLDDRGYDDVHFDVVASWGPLESTCRRVAEIPDETAGPYPGDGSNGPDVLEKRASCAATSARASGVDRSVEGVPLSLEFTSRDLANDDKPFTASPSTRGTVTRGRYSMYSEGVEDENYLRGVQVADADGKVGFTSIVPAATPGGGRTSTSRSTRRGVDHRLRQRHRDLAGGAPPGRPRPGLRAGGLRGLGREPRPGQPRDRQRVRDDAPRSSRDRHGETRVSWPPSRPRRHRDRADGR